MASMTARMEATMEQLKALGRGPAIGASTSEPPTRFNLLSSGVLFPSLGYKPWGMMASLRGLSPRRQSLHISFRLMLQETQL